MKVLNQSQGENWTLYHGDSCEVIQGIPDNSIHYSITSIPFASLYTYSNTERDLGNSRTYDEFWTHFGYMLKEWHRITMTGRMCSIHCMNLPTSKQSDGYIGLRDFRGDIIRAMERAGWDYYSEVCIWKDPVVAMQRTKALGLLHKQIKKDSCRCRQGIPDYLVTFRKRGDNDEPCTHTNESFSVDKWQEYASPVWMNIRQSDTLQRLSAREEKDEKHICPLQLEVIERGIELWTNKGDIVFDPFNGIGSSGHVALQKKRKYVGIELKESYYNQAVNNLRIAEKMKDQLTFDLE